MCTYVWSVCLYICLYKCNPPETSVRCFALRCQQECVQYKPATETAEGAGRKQLSHLWRQKGLPQCACMSADGSPSTRHTMQHRTVQLTHDTPSIMTTIYVHPIPARTSVVTYKVTIIQTVDSTCNSLTHHKSKRACCNGLV